MSVAKYRLNINSVNYFKVNSIGSILLSSISRIGDVLRIIAKIYYYRLWRTIEVRT